jgi:hypothetical protein
LWIDGFADDASANRHAEERAEGKLIRDSNYSSYRRKPVSRPTNAVHAASGFWLSPE